MEVIKNLEGQFIKDLGGIKYYIDKVKIGDKETKKYGIFINEKVNSIVSENYTLVKHEEVIEMFEEKLKNFYNGKYTSKTIVESKGLKIKQMYMLDDLQVNVDDIPYEMREDLYGQNTGDNVSPIITVKNSLDRSSSIAIDYGIYRYFCKNILTGIFKSTAAIRVRHRKSALEYDFNVELIFETINLIMNNFHKLVKIKLDGEKFARDFANFMNSEIIYQYLTKIRGDYVNGEISLWQAINEITYLTTHTPKVKVNGRKKYVLGKSQVNKATNFVYNILEENLNELYQELAKIDSSAKLNIDDEEEIEIEEITV